MAFITITGQNQIAKKQGDGEALNIAMFVLANVPNLGSEPATRIENIPNTYVVDQLAVTKSGYVNTNQVIYSLVMGSNIGDYSFNWVGLVDDEGVLIAVSYIPLTAKTKNNGPIPGNTFTRNFLIAYTGIQQTTAINVPAETWQIDFSARLSGIDERERLSNLDIYGHEGFLGDGWKVTGSAGTYSVGAGIGYVGGVRAKNTAAQEITTAVFPNEIWLNVSLQGDISDMTAVCEFVIDMGPFSDYVDENGIEHYLTKIADIDASGDVIDTRVASYIENAEKQAIAYTDQEVAALSVVSQFLPYSQDRTYSTGEITRGSDGVFYEFYDRDLVGTTKGANPTDAANRPHIWMIWDGVKPGLTVEWRSEIVPEGYLENDGDEYSRSDYRRVFAALGTKYGAGDGVNTFNVPEDRAEFKRGWDHGRGIDAGRELGSWQNDIFKLHGHPVRYDAQINASVDGFGGISLNSDIDSNYPPHTGVPGQDIGEAIGGEGGNETRPRNTAVMWITKI